MITETRSSLMKKNIIYLVIIALFICLSSSNILNAAGVSQGSNEIREAKKTVRSFLQVLMSGDIDGMKKYISKEYYDKNRVLLDENTEYHSFLAGYYQGAKKRIRSINMVDDVIEVEVKMRFLNETRGDFVIYLKREGVAWKIQEINESSRYRSKRINESKKHKKSKFPKNN